MKNIVLIGMRAAGKTFLGKWLARRTGRRFVDTDRLIQEKAEKPIARIVNESGWEYFRQLETDICRELADKTGLIIATGGGVVQRPENIENLKKNGHLVFLQVPIEILVQRVSRSKAPHRPSLTGKPVAEELLEVWQERRPLYLAAADTVIPFPGGTYGESIKSAWKVYANLRDRHLID